ncbi:hypothetical protein NXS19_001358 [Fusarium pseudograminearum]|nr:hypothetical protein NXS19_001358 [Fusarium pseudograminearum]
MPSCASFVIQYCCGDAKTKGENIVMHPSIDELYIESLEQDILYESLNDHGTKSQVTVRQRAGQLGINTAFSDNTPSIKIKEQGGKARAAY